MTKTTKNSERHWCSKDCECKKTTKKGIKAFIAEDFLRKGWRGQDHAIFAYRRKHKNESWMIPVLISPISPKKTNK